MSKTLALLGIQTGELQWVRLLVALLRHPDPHVSELARQALLYLTETAGKRAMSQSGRPAAAD